MCTGWKYYLMLPLLWVTLPLKLVWERSNFKNTPLSEHYENHRLTWSFSAEETIHRGKLELCELLAKAICTYCRGNNTFSTVTTKLIIRSTIFTQCSDDRLSLNTVLLTSSNHLEGYYIVHSPYTHVIHNALHTGFTGSFPQAQR